MANLYVWTNMYLSDKQKGIQTAHLVNAFWKKYGIPSVTAREKEFETEIASMFFDWTILSETIILFDGGNQLDLKNLLDLFYKTVYPYNCFYEDSDSLNNCLTAVGIILPENFRTEEDRAIRISQSICIWDKNRGCYDFEPNEFLKMDGKLAQLLMDSKLA